MEKLKSALTAVAQVAFLTSVLWGGWLATTGRWNSDPFVVTFLLLTGLGILAAVNKIEVLPGSVVLTLVKYVVGPFKLRKQPQPTTTARVAAREELEQCEADSLAALEGIEAELHRLGFSHEGVLFGGSVYQLVYASRHAREVATVTIAIAPRPNEPIVDVSFFCQLADGIWPLVRGGRFPVFFPPLPEWDLIIIPGVTDPQVLFWIHERRLDGRQDVERFWPAGGDVVTWLIERDRAWWEGQASMGSLELLDGGRLYRPSCRTALRAVCEELRPTGWFFDVRQRRRAKPYLLAYQRSRIGS